jgi:hypothetical protein
MALFWISTPKLKHDGNHFGFVFECAAADVDDLAVRLIKDVIVTGKKLHLQTESNGDRAVWKRETIAITARGIAQVQVYEYAVRELSQAIMMVAAP